jgi:hypothetical protein
VLPNCDVAIRCMRRHVCSFLLSSAVHVDWAVHAGWVLSVSSISQEHQYLGYLSCAVSVLRLFLSTKDVSPSMVLHPATCMSWPCRLTVWRSTRAAARCWPMLHLRSFSTIIILQRLHIRSRSCEFVRWETNRSSAQLLHAPVACGSS